MVGRTSYFLDEEAKREQDAFVEMHVRKLDSFFAAMEEGHVKAFAEAGYSLNVQDAKVLKLQSTK